MSQSSQTLGSELDNHVEEMFARADILWDDLDRLLAKQVEESDDKETAKFAREYHAGLYETLLKNMLAVTDALPWRDREAL